MMGVPANVAERLVLRSGICVAGLRPLLGKFDQLLTPVLQIWGRGGDNTRTHTHTRLNEYNGELPSHD